jgi:hypothetical protein
MTHFTPQDFTPRPARYEGFDTSDEGRDDGPSVHAIAVRLGMVTACECAECDEAAEAARSAFAFCEAQEARSAELLATCRAILARREPATAGRPAATEVA